MGPKLSWLVRSAECAGPAWDFEEVEEFRFPSRHAPTLRVAADLIAQCAVRRARFECSIDFSKNENPKDESISKKRTSTPKAKRHQNGTHEPKIGPKKAENGTRSAPKWSKEGPKMVQKATPNRKTKKGLNQDDPKTDLDPPRGRFADFSLTPRGSFGRPKIRHQKGAKNYQTSKRKIKRQTQRSKTILDPSWSNLGSILAPSWGLFLPFCIGKHNIS